jgi:hypothetical protein
MEPFEYQFVDMGIATWNTAPYLARIFIGIEFFLGGMLVLNVALRKFTVRFAMLLLVVFTGYLLHKIITEGNTGNCGCFGVAIKMTPLQGILKNIVLLVACAILYVISGKDYWNNFWKKITVPALLIASMCLGFFIYPVDATFVRSADKKQVGYRVPLELMYTDRQKEKPRIDLTKGKHVVAFLSLTCPHCRIAGGKIHVMNKKNPSIPFYLALNGDPAKLPEFFDDTHAKNIPHNLFLGPQDWMKVAGFNLPVIMYIENGIVVKKCDGIDLSQSDIEAWLKK